MSEWLSDYEEGCYIDSRDTMNTWCIGRVLIIKKDSKIIKIRYDGWSEKWDLTCPFSSHRIAPFRKKSELYTGQKGSAIRNWQFSLNELSDTSEKLRNLPKTAFEITQFLRGHLFTLVDCLLVNDYKQSSEIEASILFLTSVLKFIVDWLISSSEYFPCLYESFNNPDLFLKDYSVAYACAWPEILFSLRRLFGLDPRTSKQLVTWNFVPKDYEYGSDLKYKQNSTLSYFLNYFASCGGFSAILNLLKINEIIQNLPIYEISAYYNESFLKTWTVEFKDLFISRIKNVSEKEIKSVEKDVIATILNYLKNMCERSEENWDEYELELALRLLNCPYMEKKLKGLSEIKEIIEYVTHKDPAVRRRYKFLTPETLARWIVSQRVIESIIENNHEELFKRLPNLLIFLAGLKQITNEHIDLIWKYTQGRHGSLLLIGYQVILEITPSISFALQKYAFEKMQQTPIEEYDEKFIKMITEYSLKTISLEKKELFAMPVLYELSLDSSKIKFHLIAVDCFVETIKAVKSIEIILEYLEKCINNIKNNDSVCQSMLIIQKILQQAVSVFTYRNKEEIYKRIDVMSEGIFKLIINSFVNISAKKSLFSDTKNVKIRIKFWKFLTKSRFYDGNIDEIVELWSTIKNITNSTKAESKFSNTLLKMIKSDFNPSINSEILNRLYLSPSFSAADISEESFNVYYELFLRVNNDLRNIELRGGALYSRISQKLVSFECLISIIFDSSNENIISKSMKLLIHLNTKHHRQLLNNQEEIWAEFLNVLHNYLISSENHTQIERTLTLITMFLENSVKRDESHNPNYHILYKIQLEAEFNKLYVNFHQSTIGGIRKKIAEHYKKPLVSLTLISNNEKYDSLSDDILLSTLRPPFTFIAEFNPNRQKLMSPNLYFSKCQYFQESLLEILPRLNNSNANLAWAVLNKVTLIEKYLSQIRSFEIPIAEIFSTNSFYRLIYNLKIIENLLKIPKWLEEFINKSGVSSIIQVYLSTDFSNNGIDSLNLEYNTIMISILSEIIHYPFKITEEFIIKILNSLVQSANSCQESEESGNIAKNAKEIIYSIKSKNPDLYLETIKNYPIHDLMLASFVNCSCKYFSSTMVSFFLEQSQKNPDLNQYFLNSMISIFEHALKQNKSESFWDLLSFFINECNITPELESKYLEFITVLENHPSEVSGKEYDMILAGLLKVLKTVIRKLNLSINEHTIDLVLHKCLFEIPNKVAKDAPKCKSTQTRKDAFDLLKEMCKQNKNALTQVLKYLSSQYQDPHWRSSKNADWNYHPRAHEKSSTGYVGIKNLGCICYLISPLQLLYSVPYFRETILRVSTSSEPLSENLLYQLQHLYSGLKHSDKQYINPKALCKALKDWEGNPINVAEQMDTDEFINSFLDKIETQLNKEGFRDIIQEVFKGQLATEIIGKNQCSHKSEVNEPFISLSVAIKNKKNLIECLQGYIEGEILEGSNAYQCDHCETKVTAIRRVCIKYLPNILFISLRRFEYDYDAQKRLKINDYCEFPFEINMENYTQEGIERNELEKEKEMCLNSGQEFKKEIPAKKYPSDYYEYRLKGIVIQAGTTETGHFYAFIRENTQWFEFNDALVRPIDVSDIPNEAFGGEEKLTYSTQTGVVSSAYKSKLRNAYVLLYERVNLYSYHKEEEVLRPLQYSFDQNEIEFLEVKEENERYWRCKSSFSYEYFDFILSLLGEKSNEICKFGICFFLTVMIRSRDMIRIATCVSSIREHLKNNKEISEWLLEMVSYKHVLKELLMDCPSNEKRRVIVGLAHSALKQVDTEYLEIFIRRILANLDYAKKPNSFNFAQYFELIFRTLKLCTNLITKYSIHTRLIGYLKRLPQVQEEEIPFKHNDIYLGYDRYTHSEEKVDLSISENGASVIFLINSLQLCVSELKNDQIEYFFEDSTQNFLLSEATTKYGGRTLGQFYATLCFNNRNLTARHGKFLISGIDRANFDKHKPYMRQLFWLLGNNDSIMAERLETLLPLYMNQIQNNKKYPMATDSSVDFLIKIVAKYQHVKEWIYRKKAEFRWLETVLVENGPKQQVKGKEPSNPKNPTLRNEALKKILRQSFNEKDWEDSDNDALEENVAQGSKVEVYDFQTERWVTGSISLSIGELLWVKNESEGINKWVDNLSDVIRSPSKKKGLNKNNE